MCLLWWMLKKTNVLVPPSSNSSSSSSSVLPKTMCVWWSTAILCIAANSWNVPLWVGCAPSWNVRSPAWSTWSKVAPAGASSLSDGSSRLLAYVHCLLPIFLRQCVSICLVCPPSTPTQEPCSFVVIPMLASPVSSTRYADTWPRCLRAVIIVALWKKNKKKHPPCCLCQVTRADVDVQPYAFTTKSLFVGHMDYRYLRWQVGVLNVPSDF